MWRASVMQIENRRCSPSSTSRTVPISASVRGVGSMPPAVGTNSGSPNCARNLPSQMLTVGWLWPSASAARVTLCVM